MKIAIITVSDRASAGVYQDLAGPAVKNVLLAELDGPDISGSLVPDDAGALRAALDSAADSDIILTVGGTGLSDRDITPEAVAAWGDREVPGISEFLRYRSLEQTSRAALSRGVAVQRNRCLVVTLPGSVGGAEFYAKALAPLLEHAVSMMAGGDHAHHERHGGSHGS